MKRLSSVFALGALSLPLSIVLSPALASAAAEKLLIRDVVVSPTEAEYVGIINTGAAPVDLTNYYIADYATYYTVTTAAPASPGNNDFVVRFPAGATIQPGETQYVSLGATLCFKTGCGAVGTFTGFGFNPNYEVPQQTAAKMLNEDAAVPNMLLPFAGSVGNAFGLTNANEPVVLFYWDGATELVTDIDYVFYGATGNTPVNKTGVMVGASTYLPDTADVPANHAPLNMVVMGVPPTQNTCRIDFTEAAQLTMGSNGVNGRDECSENWSLTFAACNMASAADSDLDTVANAMDNCPNASNPGQADADGDTVGDACDNCPMVMNLDQADANSNGIGDACEGGGAGGAGGGSSSSSSSSSSSGMGGAMGTGGAGGAGVGGAVGVGGGMGTGGAGGATGTGGAGGATGTGGGMGGGGGKGTGGGMGTGGAGGASSSSSSSGSTPRHDDSDCGCEVVGGDAPSFLGLAAMAALAGIAGGRKRRRDA